MFSRDFQCNVCSIKIDKVLSAIMYFLLNVSLVQLSFPLGTYVAIHWDAPALPLTF